MQAHGSHRPQDGLTAALLALVISVGSLVLVAIPVGWLWLLSQLGQSYLGVYFLALAGCPVMMAAWAIVLARLNRAYTRVISPGEGAPPVLEASIVLAVAIAILILVTWIVLNPSGGGPIQGPWPG